ncbi:DUF429 domain-containing protein [Limnochorda pilosa]|uniref:DUF429 domain-containing protein n=1 Tax=Limnochorda pilosa TaxID=1555112 RepID=A0A0K2SIV6_LIMPI|nr:DUF429 domain-containing protein [Limnochorda pilosa]BAS26759.1 hypothetical protein LIP_0902 [Limnochorda pilosa]
MEVRLIGVDCATDESRIGVAVGVWENGRLGVRRGVRCGMGKTAVETILGECRPPERPTLLALDAPLGWPLELAEALMHHRAGEGLAVSPDAMFRRESDRFVQARLGKRPLDVGADRIARTAHAALSLLAELRSRLGLEIPLGWQPGAPPAPVAAIEVYPAATLVARGIRPIGYKSTDAKLERVRILDALRREGTIFPEDVGTFESSADVLDAALCVVAAADFLEGNVMPPLDRARAEREGWIWVRPPRTEHSEA